MTFVYNFHYNYVLFQYTVDNKGYKEGDVVVDDRNGYGYVINDGNIYYRRN